MNCLICNNATKEFTAPKGRLYHECVSCGFVFLDVAFHPSFSEAEKRYLLHTNGEDDPGYASYLQEFYETLIKPRIPPGRKLLDFGCGPGPVLPKILEKDGFSVDLFDPHFADSSAYKSRKYGGIILLEVAEHLPSPIEVFSELGNLLEQGGSLFVRTGFRPSSSRGFLRWWYREDSTHVSFFTAAAMEALSARLGFDLAFSDGRRDTVFISRT